VKRRASKEGRDTRGAGSASPPDTLTPEDRRFLRFLARTALRAIAAEEEANKDESPLEESDEACRSSRRHLRPIQHR
jgi:hypothetical protein